MIGDAVRISVSLLIFILADSKIREAEILAKYAQIIISKPIVGFDMFHILVCVFSEFDKHLKSKLNTFTKKCY